jgi:hypothetical protein
MAVALSPIGGAGAQFFDNNGNPLSGGKLYTYEAGTTTPAATFTSLAGTTAHTNPIILDSAGRVPGGEIWLTLPDFYKFVLRTSTEVLLGTWDNIQGYSSGSVAYAATEVQIATANQTLFVLNDMFYNPSTNTLAVYVDGVNQVVNNSYVESTPTSVTFMAGLHVGAVVKFVNVNVASADASAVSYEPGFVGSVATTVQTKLRETVSVKDFGAVGDGVTDDTAAIQAAADYCAANDAFLMGVPGTYLVTSTLVFKCNGDLSAMQINANGSAVSPVVRFGSVNTGDAGAVRNKNFVLPQVFNTTKPSDGWGTAGIGIELAEVFACNLTIVRVQGFTTGVRAGGYNTGFAYNQVFMQDLLGNKVNLHLKPLGATGFCNQNSWFNGRLSRYSSDTTNYTGTRGILIEGQDPTGNPAAPNNNTFINCSLEGMVEFQLDVFGNYNIFENCRWEGVKKVRFYDPSGTGNLTVGNLIVGGFQAFDITYTFDGFAVGGFNSAINGRRNAINSENYIFNLVNQTSATVTGPHLQGFEASKIALEKSNSSTDWSYRLFARGLNGKRDTDTHNRVEIDWYTGQGRIRLGDNGAAASTSIESFGTQFLVLNSGTGVRPSGDNTMSLGSASFKWSTVYAATGTINTSDEREKQQIRSLTDAERAVAVRLKSLIRAFKFNDAVKKKGDGALIHIGVIAQDVKAAFEAEGLDANRYGMFCADVVEDNSTVYGVRYEELLAFVIGAI